MSSSRPDSVPPTLKTFANKNGSTSTVLRLRDSEVIEDAVERFRREGWSVPDLGGLTVKEDQVGKYIELK